MLHCREYKENRLMEMARTALAPFHQFRRGPGTLAVLWAVFLSPLVDNDAGKFK
jgi:hypothetical protein